MKKHLLPGLLTLLPLLGLWVWILNRIADGLYKSKRAFCPSAGVVRPVLMRQDTERKVMQKH